MAVRTGAPGSGAAGLSLLVVPLKNYPGVSMRRLKVGGQVSAGTTYIELDEVKVPVENLIGVEGMGMRYIMTNFNHERLVVAISITRQARVALAAAFEYVMKREAFGKPLSMYCPANYVPLIRSEGRDPRHGYLSGMKSYKDCASNRYHSGPTCRSPPIG